VSCARRWTYPPTGRGGRGVDPEVVDLVVRMARDNAGRPHRGINLQTPMPTGPA
jgi:hypothetical protein